MTKPAVEFTEKEREQMKPASRDLLAKLKQKKVALHLKGKFNATTEMRSKIQTATDARCLKHAPIFSSVKY